MSEAFGLAGLGISYMGATNPSNGPIKIVLEDELVGEPVGTTDYFFMKIGEAVPLKGDDSNFDLKSLPSQPLAVSERFRLIFVAHSSGFFVARTKDVIDSAKCFKEKGNGSSVQQLSLVDVSFGRVHILALSTDNSMLAASVSSDIRFFSVDNFTNKEVKQPFSCSLNDSAFVKDMRWITTSENSYVVLSNTGELYYGEAGFPLKYLMDSVEAVDWGVEGTFVAVARKNVLSIFSAKFEEWVSISLSFKSWIGDSDANGSIKVDSVKCIRPDSIIIGCFQLTEDGKEKSYLLQVFRSRPGGITDGCSEFVVQSFYDIYPGLIDDIVPFGSGPYLLLAYIEQCQLAINANMKNTDEHIMLLGWSVDVDKSKAVVVDINRDNWLPRIDLQENGDDNLLVGLCIDNVSIYQKVGVQHGVESAELSPYCVLICLTLEGKLVMFHVASLAGREVMPEVVSTMLGEEDASGKLPVGKDSTSLHGLQKQELDQASVVSANLKSKASEAFDDNPYQTAHAEDFTEHWEVESVANLQSLKSNVQQMVPDVDLNQETDSHNPCTSDEQWTNIGPKTVAPGTSIGSFTVNSHSAACGLSSYNSLQETTEISKVLCNTSCTWDTHRTSPLLPGETVSLPKDSDVSSFSTSSSADSVGYQSQIYTTSSTIVPGSIGRKPLLVHDMNGVSPAINSASRPVQRGGRLTSIGAGNMQPVSVCSSHLLSSGNSTTGKSSTRKLHPSNEQQGPSSKLGISRSDLSKQFGNINEMTKELDLLLRSIEEAGGFRDACTRSLRGSIEIVEQGMDTISKKCKIWMCQVDEHLKEVLYLLNKTIRVVARKVYMEGIYKQASDSRYWDLWNRQKLNSELELKRQHILSLNQDLTYQLIELERHFNALELNKFSQHGGSRCGHGAFQSRYGHARYIQSLHSLHNAISSQLGAAENLSECLSTQMAALSLSSLSEEQKNVKELFETIGIPYDASFSSPDMKGFMRTSSKKILFPDLTTNNDMFKRVQASSMKSCESEMARRRRDSLDQSWTYFEPPKTIIKRKLLQEIQKPNWNGSFFSMNEAKVKTSMLEESAPHPSDAKFPSIVFPASKMKVGTLDSHIELEEVPEHSKVFQADNLLAPTQVSESKSHVSQRSNISAAPSSSISASSTLLGRVAELNVDKSRSEENISALPTFGGSSESLSSTIKTSSASPLSSSVFSAALPLTAVSVALSRCVTSSNTSMDSDHNMPASSAPASLCLSNQASRHIVPSLNYPSCFNSSSESHKPDIRAAAVSNLKTNFDASAEQVTRLNEPLDGKSELKLGPSGKFSPTDEQSSNNITSSALNVVQDSQSEQASDAPMQLSTSFLASASLLSGKNGGLDVGISYEDEMEEEAPETSNMTELHLGSLGGFGISPIPNPSLPKPNPFGGSFSNVSTSLSSSSISLSVPGGELFRPASFTFPSPQSSATARSTNSGAFSGGFSAGATDPAPTASVFGQPAQIGSGQQVLGSVLGTFGQSRQFGSGLPGSGFATHSGYGGGFAGSSSTSGFSSAATGGGFAGISSTGGGFAGIASTGGGFAGVASTGSGFSGIASVGGGFTGAASSGGGFATVSPTGGFSGAPSGGGFGAYSSQGSSSFAAFGTVGGSKPPELFTHMRK